MYLSSIIVLVLNSLGIAGNAYFTVLIIVAYKKLKNKNQRQEQAN